MNHPTLTPRLQQVAESAKKYYVDRYGRNGLKLDKPIHSSIRWQPTIQLKAPAYVTVAIEVADIPFPNVLALASLDARSYSAPVAIILACPSEIFGGSSSARDMKILQNGGFGILTVDHDGFAAEVSPCCPAAQHIPPDEFKLKAAVLPTKLKRRMNVAYETYRQNAVQGVQDASQCVESYVNKLAEAAAVKFHGSTFKHNSLQQTVQALLRHNEFQTDHSIFGATDHYVSKYRNGTSHPPDNELQAMERINYCRAGLLLAVDVITGLVEVAKNKDLTVTIP